MDTTKEYKGGEEEETCNLKFKNEKDFPHAFQFNLRTIAKPPSQKRSITQGL